MSNKFKINNVYYYAIRPKLTKDSSNELEKIQKKFKKIFKFEKDDLHEVSQNDGTVNAMIGKEYNKRYVGGAFIYTLESNIPPKYDRKSKLVSPINLSGFDGLGYDSAYFYDSELMILAFEKRVPGTSLNSLRAFVLRNYEICGFDFVAISEKDLYEKLLESHGVTGLDFKIITTQTPSNISKNVQKGVSESMTLLDESDGQSIHIKISSGKSKFKQLSKDFVSNLAKWAINSVGGKYEASKFEVNIIDVDSEKVIPIDLILGRVKDVTKIEKVRAIDRFSIREKIKQLEGHYLRRRDAIELGLNK